MFLFSRYTLSADGFEGRGDHLVAHKSSGKNFPSNAAPLVTYLRDIALLLLLFHSLFFHIRHESIFIHDLKSLHSV